jgi:hypothetical protein
VVQAHCPAVSARAAGRERFGAGGRLTRIDETRRDWGLGLGLQNYFWRDEVGEKSSEEGKLGLWLRIVRRELGWYELLA